jgi:rhodanese-related sulfurtransferase
MRFIAFAVSLVTFVLFAPALTAAQHTTDSLDKVKQQVEEKKALLVDVREQAEWDKGHIDRAVLVPLSELAKKQKDEDFRTTLEKKLPKDKVIYCHCAKGQRALLAADVFKGLGYDVRPLKPGYKQLLDAGLPPAKAP